MIRIFISSVQREFAEERMALRDYLRGDPLMRRFFDVFLFENVPAADRRADDIYLDEVARCDLFVGLLGNEYGTEDAGGLSPTHREFGLASELHKHRLIFIKGAEDHLRHSKMQELVKLVSAQLTYKRFGAIPELVSGVYAALVTYLESRGIIHIGPFDAAACERATLTVYHFIRSKVRPLPWRRSRQTDSFVSGLQRDGL